MKIIFAYNGPFWTLDNIVFLNNILKKNFSTITIDNKSYELSFDIYNFSLNLGIIEGKEEKNFFNDLNKLPDIYDGIIFANIINHTPFIKIWYDVVINFLKKNKIVSYTQTTLCSDYFCPTFYKKWDKYLTNNILNLTGNQQEDEKLLKKILLFLPPVHYYGYYLYVFGMSNSNYYPYAYNENKKFLQKFPILPQQKLISKDDLYNYYKIDKKYKLIVFYPAKEKLSFWKDFWNQQDGHKSIKKTISECYGINENDKLWWKIYKPNRLFYYNMDEIAEILESLGYKIIVKRYRFEYDEKEWGNTCFRSDLVKQDVPPITHLKKVIIADNKHTEELIEYSDACIITSDTSAGNIFFSYKKPVFYISSKKYDWLKFCLGGARYNTMYGNLSFIEDLFDNDKILKQEVFKDTIKKYFNGEIEYKNDKQFFIKSTVEENLNNIITNIVKEYQKI